eukprot:jgi/Tetstr1/459389/TSEL_004768.t1
MATPGETPPEDSGSFPVAATAGEAQPIPLEGGQEGTQPTLATMMSMLQRLADRVETMSTEQAKMQDVAQATTAAMAEIRRLDEYAALAVEAAERETDVHREIRRERLNIMNDDGDDDEQYYSSAEGEATEQEDDLLMARRLTEEEFERFKKEGRCFICRAKGHVASACPSKKKKISEYRPRKTRPGNEDVSRPRAARDRVKDCPLKRLARLQKYNPRILERH